MSGKIYVGVGGWTYAPWRGVFYPKGLPQARELEHASRRLTSIEINGTYYSLFKPEHWTRWRAETPDGFVFSVKGSRYCTNRRELGTAGESVSRFVGQGLARLGDRLGPINWQLAPTKRFDAEEIDAFLALLPRKVERLALRHALEVRHPSFACAAFVALCRKHNVAITVADDPDFPAMDEPTADFTYARLMSSEEDIATGYAAAALQRWAKRAQGWAARGDAFVYFISGAKVRDPAAAEAFLAKLERLSGGSRRR